MRGWLILGGVLLAAATSARADILVWRDADGVRHYTNRADAVPSDLTPEVVIRGDSVPEAPAAAVAPAPAPAPAPVVAADATRLDEAYRAGLSAGLNLGAADDGYASGGGGGGGAAAGGTVEIIGPLAVANARSTDDGAWGPYYGWPGGYFPFVTTGFDRGRSRHQTLRMLLQDQFAIDRDGPYAYNRWDRPGVGPALAPFLPRGLPLPVQQYGRVLYR
jgi:hypothetical protein